MKKFTLFFTSLCLFQTLNAQLSPNVRKLFSAVLIEKKLYIYGGFMDNEDAKAQSTPDDRFFYLDVSIPFDTSSLPWRAIPDNAKNLPLGSLSSIATGGVAASVGGVNNDTIFFFNNEKTNTTLPIHSYDSSNNVWNTQNFSGVRPIGRNQMRTITDYNGKIYLLTGFDFTVQGITRSNGLFVCDTINLDCAIKDAPISVLGYGVTLLPNGNLIYIGGDRNYAPVPNGLNSVHLYDPINDKWDSKSTTGNIPPNDVGITTVLGLSGDKIIFFGGNNGDNNNIYVLDTTDYEWYVPKVRGKSPAFKRGEHCANVIGKYMVITFGKRIFISKTV
jgi:N-acetylneuraminic acid mutarotase